MKAIPVFRTVPALLAAGLLLLGCETQHPIAAPDETGPQFLKGGVKGGAWNTFDPIPITLKVTGGFLVDATAWITNETADFIRFGTDMDSIEYTVNFPNTAHSARNTLPPLGFDSCADQERNNRGWRAPQAVKERLIGWLDGGPPPPPSTLPPLFHRWGTFGVTIDLASLAGVGEGIPSAGDHHINTRAFESDPFDDWYDGNQHVSLSTGDFYQSWVGEPEPEGVPPVAPPTVSVRTIFVYDPDPSNTVPIDTLWEYTFAGGVVGMHDRSSSEGKYNLACANVDDEVVVTINRQNRQ